MVKVSAMFVVAGVLMLVGGTSALMTHRIVGPGEVSTERMLASSVSIKTISHIRTDRFGDSVWEPAFGSGFLVSREPCEVWTNHHVVAEAATVRVIPRGVDSGLGIPARVVHKTPRPDIAVLRLDRCDGIEVVQLGDSSRVEAGMEAYAVGNPLGRNPDSISRGIISHAARNVGTNTYLQTDANINPGNSGGALFDRRGRVIGMNVALASTKKGGNTGIGYAIPVNRVRHTVQRLRTHPPGWGTGGIAGIASNLTAAEAAVFKVPNGLPAIILTRSPQEGPGAGLLLERDVVYEVGRQSVYDVEHLQRLFAERDPGAEVTVGLVRDGDLLDFTLILGDGYESGETPGAEPYEGLLGMTLEDWSQRGGEEGQFMHPVITRLHSLGPAHLAEISSSQHSVAFNGTKLIEYLLDVKTVTGVVLDGKYFPIADIAAVNRFAADAHARRVPLLLEIEQWARKDPRNARTELVHRKTAFFKVEPSPVAKMPARERDEPGSDATALELSPRNADQPA